MMDGFEVARQIRQDPSLRGVFMIALSGYAAPEDIDRSKEAGFDEHMAKPPRLEIIEQVISSVQTRERKTG
jgi:CheY-like chemotaxis protein